jgi:hypothetical protein
VPARDLRLSDGQRLVNVSLRERGPVEYPDGDDDLKEYAARVRWIKSVEKEEAKTYPGIIRFRGNGLQVNHPNKLQFLAREFEETRDSQVAGAGIIVDQAWSLRPGDQIERVALQRAFGGSGQGGITPSNRSSNIFLFADPDEGPIQGYVDGWKSDGLYDYTGSGQIDDQRLGGVNGSMLEHRISGKTLRVFRGSRGVVSYVGAFELDDTRPYYRADAPETKGGPTRSVVVFRLRPPDGDVSVSSESPPISDAMEVRTLAIANQYTERHVVNPTQEPTTAERREAILVLAFRDHLVFRGMVAVRLAIRPPEKPSRYLPTLSCQS